MKSVQLIHNPGAGDQILDKTQILNLLEKNGYECGYLSTKKNGWKDFDTDKDILVIAGGDGTVRKVIRQILKRSAKENPEKIGLIPLGTANNVARTLHINKEARETVKSWSGNKIKRFDVGKILNKKNELFFIESFGFGLFPELMQEMQKINKMHTLSSQQEIEKAWEVLGKTLPDHKSIECTLRVDGKKYTGNFLWVEIMNTPFIGPNIHLSPQSDPTDGILEVVLIEEDEREGLQDYVSSAIRGEMKQYPFRILRGKNISIKWRGTFGHTDDKIIWFEKNTTFSVRMQRGLINFLVP